jgi:hypothetical protein
MKQIYTAAVISAVCPGMEVSVSNLSWSTSFFGAFLTVHNQPFISFDAKYLLQMTRSL